MSYLKVDANGRVLEVGEYLMLGSGAGEQLRVSAAAALDRGERLEAAPRTGLAWLGAHLIDQVLDEGAHGKYASNPDRWLIRGSREHLHASYTHLLLALGGDSSEAHLEHALCRVAMAIWVRNNPEATDHEPHSTTHLADAE